MVVIPIEAETGIMSFDIYATVTRGAVSELSQWGEDDVEGGVGMLFGGIRDSR